MKKFRHVIQMPVRNHHGSVIARRNIIFEIQAQSSISAGLQLEEMIKALQQWCPIEQWRDVFQKEEEDKGQ